MNSDPKNFALGALADARASASRVARSGERSSPDGRLDRATDLIASNSAIYRQFNRLALNVRHRDDVKCAAGHRSATELTRANLGLKRAGDCAAFLANYERSGHALSADVHRNSPRTVEIGARFFRRSPRRPRSLPGAGASRSGR